MIIANIQTSESEDHSIHTKNYGAGAVLAKHARILLNDGKNEFWDIAPHRCFRNVRGDERPDRCIELGHAELSSIKLGMPIKRLLPTHLAEKIDLFVFNNDDVILNLEGLHATQALWLAFVNQTCHPLIPHCLIYSDDQRPNFNPQYTKIHKVKIGKPIKLNFCSTPKEDFLFQCTRNDEVMDTIHTVNLCNAAGIRGYFAGPILGDYPLLKYIDNKNSFYLGTIGEKQKLWYSHNARMYGCIQNWDTIFSLSAVEALGQGTPIIARNLGCFKYLIDEGENGFYYNDEDTESFVRAWESAASIDQYKCYNKGKEYSDVEMVESFKAAFENILK